MTKRLQVERNLIGREDLLLGEGTETQQRNGQDVEVTKINMRDMPYDENRTLSEAFQEERATAYAHFYVDDRGHLMVNYAEEGQWYIDDRGHLILDPDI